MRSGVEVLVPQARQNLPFLAVVPQAPGATAENMMDSWARGGTRRPTPKGISPVNDFQKVLVADVSSGKPRRIHPCSENQCIFFTANCDRLQTQPDASGHVCAGKDAWKNAKTHVANSGPKDHGSPKLRMWFHESEVLCVLEVIG